MKNTSILRKIEKKEEFGRCWAGLRQKEEFGFENTYSLNCKPGELQHEGKIHVG